MTFTTLIAGVFAPHDLSQALTQWNRIADTHAPTALVLGQSQHYQLKHWAWSGAGEKEFQDGVRAGEVRFGGTTLAIRLLDRRYHGDEHLELL